jgi:RHH-type proline utilization regulon transcriptional repressor/proline dehydrogenase/delta 1-pyrroline-5-carboxylate dehydrogenase
MRFAILRPVRPPPRLRAAITAACRMAEPEAVAPLLEQARCPPPPPRRCRTWHCNWPSSCAPQGRQRQRAGAGLLQEFSLSSQEGVALMCLAEALLRIPDAPPAMH